MAKRKANILVVDDERGIRTLIKDLLSREGYSVETADNASDALTLFAGKEFDLILSDIKMPQMDGIELCKRIFDINPEQLVILLTGYPSVETAVAGLKIGAADYITKPFTPDELRIVVSRALDERSRADEYDAMRRELRVKEGVDSIIGSTADMQNICALIRKVSQGASTVLISGESGTGKELVAKAIHVHSKRAARSFVAINCGAMVGQLLESELFGHTRGAFTGAHANKIGLAEKAHLGTLFLDEIGELSLDMQPKLLRLLQEGELKPVGDVNTRKVDVRIVAATNKNLSEEVKAGRFREDLYYRLNVVELRVPPLRERTGDIAQLAHHFLRVGAKRTGRNATAFSKQAMEFLIAQPWPGNVRQLQNTIERALILGDGETIDLSELSDDKNPVILAPTNAESIHAPPYPFDHLSLEDVERRHIEYVLTSCGGQKSKASEMLGINRTTLWKKLRRYEMAEDDDNEES